MVTMSTPTRGQVGQAAVDLVGGLAHADDQPRLRRQPGRLGPGQHRQAAGVAGRRPHGALQAGHGLDVVVEHVGPNRRTAAASESASPLASEINVSTRVSGQRSRIAATHRGHVGHPAVGEVVAGDHRQHGVSQAHARDRVGDTAGLVVGRGERLAGVDQAEPAGPRAPLAEHHERRGAVGPAVAEVRAAGLLADGDQAVVAHRLLQREHLRPVDDLRSQPVGLARRDRQTVGDAGLRQHEPAHDCAPGPSPRENGDRSSGRCFQATSWRSIDSAAPHRRGVTGDDVDDVSRSVDVDALLGQRRDRLVGDATGHDVVAQVAHVGRDVEGEAVHRPAVRQAHADRADLARVAAR